MVIIRYALQLKPAIKNSQGKRKMYNCTLEGVGTFFIGSVRFSYLRYSNVSICVLTLSDDMFVHQLHAEIRHVKQEIVRDSGEFEIAGLNCIYQRVQHSSLEVSLPSLSR